MPDGHNQYTTSRPAVGVDQPKRRFNQSQERVVQAHGAQPLRCASTCPQIEAQFAGGHEPVAQIE